MHNSLFQGLNIYSHRPFGQLDVLVQLQYNFIKLADVQNSPTLGIFDTCDHYIAKCHIATINMLNIHISDIYIQTVATRNYKKTRKCPKQPQLTLLKMLSDGACRNMFTLHF